MCHKSHLGIFVLTVVLASLASAAFTTRAAADEGVPPPAEAPTEPGQAGTDGTSGSVPAVDEAPVIVPGDSIAEVPAAVETIPDQVTEEPDSVTGAAVGDAAQDTTDPAGLLAEVPADTEVVVVSETGEPVPLATEEAAQIVSSGDPTWCPSGKTPGDPSCSPLGETSLSHLINWMQNHESLAAAGVIWIEGSYDSAAEGVAGFTLNGGWLNLDSWAPFSLTLQGGWAGCSAPPCVTTVDHDNPSTFNGDFLNITNWQGDITLNDIEITNVVGGTALDIETTKKITLTHVKVHDNTGAGAYLRNCPIAPAACSNPVLVSSSQFYWNSGGSGLVVQSHAVVTLNSVIAEHNAGFGVEIDNSGAASAAAVTLTGLNILNDELPYYDNTFSDNGSTGLYIRTKGLVTISNITAGGNTGFGVDIDNCLGGGGTCAGTGAVTLTGTNVVSKNSAGGLYISSGAGISASNLIVDANANGYGAELDNSASALAQPVTLTGSNEFNYNKNAGLTIYSKGNVTLNNVNASGSVQDGGLYIDNCLFGVSSCAGTGNVSMTGVNIAQNNYGTGANIYSGGTVTISNIDASFNGIAPGGNGYGVWIDNCQYFNPAPGPGVATCTRVKTVTLTGTNVFNWNDEAGIYVQSGGTISLNNVTANHTANGDGAYLHGQFTNMIGDVKITGINTFSDNSISGLEINSRGNVTLSTITAMGNGGTSGAGVYVSNATSPGKSVTLTGSATLLGNKTYGLCIESAGNVSLANLTASYNGYFSGGNSYGYGVYIDNQAAASATVTLAGTNIFNDNYYAGLYIWSHGNISASNVSASRNYYYDSGTLTYHGGDGVMLKNDQATGSPTISLTGVNLFNENLGSNLYIVSKGAVTLNNVTASGTLNGNGAEIDTCAWDSGLHVCVGTGNVSLTGINNFNNNHYTGLAITSGGAITLASVSANSNGLSASGFGAYLDDCGYDGISDTCKVVGKAITLTGTNTFNGNYSGGLEVYSGGAIAISNLNASGNLHGSGSELLNQHQGAIGTVTLTGVNVFNGNLNGSGLSITSLDAVSLSSVTATGNGLSSFGYGVYIYNSDGTPKAVTVTGFNNFSGNYGTDLYIRSRGAVTLNNVTANGSLWGAGADIDNCLWDGGIPGCQGASSISVVGISNFSDDHFTGLTMVSGGAVSLASITANGNGLTASGYGVFVDNCGYDGISDSCKVVAKAVQLTGTNTFNDNYNTGLFVNSGGPITINNLTASQNAHGMGAELQNYFTGSDGGATLTGLNVFTDNLNATGLSIESLGAISLSNLTATGNGLSSSGDGVYISNSSGSSKAVTLSGTSNLSGNFGPGLDVSTAGPITINNLTASDSLAGSGASLQTTYNSATANSVALTGTNTFERNSGYGLYFYSSGMVTVSSLVASHNHSTGVYIDNTASGSGSPRKVVLSGTDVFTDNYYSGLQIESFGQVTFSTTNITANRNGQSLSSGYGLTINNCQNLGSGCQVSNSVSIAGVNQFNENYRNGLNIVSGGAISVSNVTAECNGMANHCSTATGAAAYGIRIDNSSPLTGTPGVTVSGTNVFLHNRDTGLYVLSKGAIAVNNASVTASVNGSGANLQNNGIGAVGGVTLTGTSVFDNNQSYGLYVLSLGAIVTNNLSANNNGSAGASLSNGAASLPANVTLNGLNTYDHNQGTGLIVVSRGNILASNVHANNNQVHGAQLSNTGGTGTVTLTGVNQFDNNTQRGLYIATSGNVSLTKIEASFNDTYGLYVNTASGTVSMMCGSFVGNPSEGIRVVGASGISLTGVISGTSAGNGAADTYSTTPTVIRTCPLP